MKPTDPLPHPAPASPAAEAAPVPMGLPDPGTLAARVRYHLAQHKDWCICSGCRVANTLAADVARLEGERDVAVAKVEAVESDGVRFGKMTEAGGRERWTYEFADDSPLEQMAEAENDLIMTLIELDAIRALVGPDAVAGVRRVVDAARQANRTLSGEVRHPTAPQDAMIAIRTALGDAVEVCPHCGRYMIGPCPCAGAWQARLDAAPAGFGEWLSGCVCAANGEDDPPASPAPGGPVTPPAPRSPASVDGRGGDGATVNDERT